jgi:hydrogenase expression/formation protein HypC
VCLGIPGRVIEVYEADGVRMGRVDFAGIIKEICLAYVPEATVGDYTIVHVGFAITQLDEESAQESLRLFAELGLVEEELNPEIQHEVPGGVSQPGDRPAPAG